MKWKTGFVISTVLLSVLIMCHSVDDNDDDDNGHHHDNNYSAAAADVSVAVQRAASHHDEARIRADAHGMFHAGSSDNFHTG